MRLLSIHAWFGLLLLCLAGGGTDKSPRMPVSEKARLQIQLDSINHEWYQSVEMGLKDESIYRQQTALQKELDGLAD